MKLSLEQNDAAGVAHVAAHEHITVKDFATPGSNPLESLLGPDWASRRVLLGLAKLDFIDSSAIGWLIDCQRKFKEKGGRMTLHSPKGRVLDMIEMLKMRQILEIWDAEADAEKALLAAKKP